MKVPFDRKHPFQIGTVDLDAGEGRPDQLLHAKSKGLDLARVDPRSGTRFKIVADATNFNRVALPCPPSKRA
jgi:hypothetical protein